jgi:4-amino-4-deoxy-L-arabinose transferase-like glycosyltransferase
VTGCGCLLAIAAIVGLIVFLIFGSTDAGEPIDTAVALFLVLLSGKWLALVPRRRVLVRARDA